MLASQNFLFNLNPQLLFDAALLAIAVFFLYLLMSYLLFNPARKLLKDRQDRIAAEIDDANADKESAAALKAEYEAKLKEVDKEAEAIHSEARQKALQNQSRIVNEAKEEAARIIKHAEEEAELEKLFSQHKTVIADPLFRPICKGASFVSLPHVAFSGRCFLKDIPDLIDKDVSKIIVGHAAFESYQRDAFLMICTVFKSLNIK